MKKVIAMLRILFIIIGLASVSYSSSLERDCRIHGRVTDLFGSPIPKANVIVEFAKAERVATVLTDENGEFCFTEKIEGRFVVTVKSPGFLSETIESSIFEGKSTPFNIGLRVGIVDLRPIATIQGVVKKDNKAVKETNIIAISAYNPQLRQTTMSDATGRFVLTFSEPGTYILVAISSNSGETAQLIKILGSIEHKVLIVELTL